VWFQHLVELSTGIFERARRRQETYGRGEIRTPEAGVTRLPVFKTGAFNRSATLPAREAEG
jgi:hypothetical protein